MFYSIQHLTKFHYASPVSESVMEARMHPRSEGNQRCLTFHLAVSPRCRVFAYRDHVGNNIHHFDIPGQHSYLVIVAESLLDVQPSPEIPAFFAARCLGRSRSHGADGGLLGDASCPASSPSRRRRLLDLARSAGSSPAGRSAELIAGTESAGSTTGSNMCPRAPRWIRRSMRPSQSRQGVCQDFAHIMIALVRRLRIPCRYVSGYLYRRAQDHDRSVVDATHAWVEAFLPPLGWVGFDPTNCLLAGDRHIRTAIGRDYADVPPTRGIFRGHTPSELSVAVRVTASVDAA